MNFLRTFLIFVCVLTIASFFRLYALNTTPPGLYPDEAMNGNNALEAIGNSAPGKGFKVFYPENNGREGLFINIQGLFLKMLIPQAGGDAEPWMLRLPSALFGIITVAGVFFLAKELFKKNSVALLSMFLLATSFWHINFSRIGFRAIMAPCFLIWGIYLLLLAFRKLQESKDSLLAGTISRGYRSIIHNSLFPLFAGAVYGLGMHSYIAYRATPLIIAVIFLFFARTIGWKKMGVIAMWFVLGALIVSVPLISYFLQNPHDFFGRTSEVSVFSSSSPLGELGLNVIKTIGMLFFVGDSNWRHNLSGAPELLWPVAILFLIGTVVGIKTLFKNVKVQMPNDKSMTKAQMTENGFSRFSFGIWILAAWLITAIFPVVFSNEGIPHALRSILMIPPVFILAGFGGITLYEWMLPKWERAPWKRVLPATAFLLLAFVVAVTYWNYFMVWGENRNTAGAFTEEYVTMGKKLNEIPKNVPKYVIVEAGGVLVRGIPMPAQTVMFITDTFTKGGQEKKNIHYVLPENAGSIPEGGYVVTIK